MPRAKVYHLRFVKERWELKGASAKQASRVFTTKEEALKESPKVVKNQKPSRLKIYDRNGKIQEERNY